jgi:HK97 family phage major capsid protein
MSEYTMLEVGQAVDELRKSVEAGTITEEKRARLDKVLDDYEVKNQEIVKANQQIVAHEENIKSFKAELEEKGVESGKIREQVDQLEISLAKSLSNSVPDDYREGAEYKAFNSYVIEGEERISSEQKAELRTDSATEGGVLVVPEMENMILKQITEIDPIRSIARVRATSSKSLVVPVRTGIPTANYEGEAETSQESTSTYGSETLTAFRLTHTVPITRDMLMDSSFDMESEIILDAAEAFAYGEGNGFVVGSGHKQPEGFMTDSRVAITQSSSANNGELSADDFLTIQGQLKTGYNGTFVLNRRTLANLRTQKSSDGNYLFAPGLNGGAPATLAGDPYVIANSMPDIANSAKCVAYGAFNVGYLIIDRTATEVIRDDYTRKKEAIVEFTIHRWNTGKVVLPEAIKILQLKP